MTPSTRRALLVFTGVSTLALSSAPAFAACTVPSGMGGMESGNMPTSGQTVTCADNLDSDGIDAPTVSDVTVDVVGPAGGISVTGTSGILLGSGATITVSGESNRPINTSGDTAPGIDVTRGATITIDGQVTTAGESSPAIRATDDATVTVGTSGLVRTGGGMSPAITVGANSTVMLMGDGGDIGARVTTGNSDSDAIVLGGTGSSLTVQDGATVTTSSGMSNPVQVDGRGASVTVFGDVRSSSGDATAILGTAQGMTVTVKDGGFVTAQSSGSDAIRAEGTMAMITIEDGGEVSISSGNSAAIVAGESGMVQIDGSVKASSSQSQGVVLGDGSMLTIGSTGVIETSSSESQAVLVNEGAGTATITVERGGTIDAIGAQAIVDRGMTDTTITVDGEVFGGSSDPALDLGAGNDTVTINGTVRGSSADPVIMLGDGDDTLTENSSATVTGPGVLVDAGGGNDTLTLANSKENRSSSYNGFETIDVRSDSGSTDSTSAMSGFVGPAPQANGTNTSLIVDNDQSMNTVNARSGGSVNVDSGGSVNSANASEGGSVSVRNGGRAESLNSDGAGSAASVENGGSAGQVSASNGGATNVRSGARAGVSRTGSNTGGTVTFESGSNADIARTDFGGGGQTVDYGGTRFDAGGTITVTDSAFLVALPSGNGLRFDYGANAFESAGFDANTRAAGRALDATVAAQPGYLDANRAIATATPGETAPILSDISGAVVSQTAAGGIMAAQTFTDTLRPGGGGIALPLVAAPVAAPAGTQVFGQSVVVPVRVIPRAETRAWVGVTAGSIDIDAGNGAAYDGTTLGGAIGIERSVALGPVRDATVGLALGYTETDIDGRFRDGEADGYHAGIYMDGSLGGADVGAALGYTRSDIEADGADGHGDIFTARVDLAYDLLSPSGTGLTLGPVGRVEYTYADFDGLNGAGPLGTTLDGDFSQVVTGIGLRAGLETGTVSLHGEVLYEHAFGDTTLDLRGGLPGSRQGFDTSTALLGEKRIRIGLGARVDVTERLSLGIDYDGTFGDDGDSHGGMLRASFSF